MNRLWPAAAGIAGGVLFYSLGIPAGGMVGALLGTSVAQVLCKNKLVIAYRVKIGVRVLLGIFVGMGITIEGLAKVQHILWPALINIGNTIVITTIATLVLTKVFKWNFTDAILSSMPAGLSEITMNAEDMGADTVLVTTIHLFRFVSILTIIPLIIKFFI